jgi:hypothetical protein
MGHTFRAKETAEEIGWPPGNPFQSEIAVTNLAFGVLGLLSIRFRGLFWLATAVGQAIFLLGAACMHTREMLREKNFNPSNAGAIFFDILEPLAHLGLLKVYNPLEQQTRPWWRKLSSSGISRLWGYK